MRYNTRFKDNNFLTPTLYTQALSEYTQNLKYEDLPAEVVERAKAILLDTIGAALAASGTSIAGKACRMALSANNGEGGPVSVWGTGKQMSAINAALVMGTMADILDWEDCAWTGHPSAAVIPCAWIAAQERHKSGRDLIAAIVAGYEVYQRIAMAVQPSDERWKTRGWGLTNWQIFAATISACKVYGLDARKVNQAIGLACESSTMPTTYHAATMSDFRPFEYGYRARDGFLIAKSVEQGIHNNLDGLDDPRCYAGVMCGDAASHSNVGEKLEATKDEADLSWLTRDLGTRYLLMETQFKHWPADMWSQAAVELVIDLVRQHGFAPNEIAEILVDPATENRMLLPDGGFDSITYAQFSTPYAIAAALCQPAPGADWYTPEMMHSAQVLDLAKRVKAGSSPADSAMSCFRQFRTGTYPVKTVTVTLKDGTQYTGQMDCPPGHPSKMLSREEQVDRFRARASAVLEGDRLEQVLQGLSSIETVDDIGTLAELLR